MDTFHLPRGNRGARRFDVSIRNVDEPGLAEEIVALLNEALPGAGFTEEWFFWKHRDNPQGRSIVAVAFDSETDHCAAVRIFWRVDLCDGERSVVAYQPCDTATRREFRRLGLFTRLTAVATEEARRRDARLLFSFPNERAKSGNLKLGWADIGGVWMSIRPFRLWRTLRGTLRARGRLGELREIDIRSEEESPDWRRWDTPTSWPFGLLHGARTAAYLAWRYADHPLHRYHLIPYEDGAIIGRLGKRSGLTEFRVVGWLGDARVEPAVAWGCIREMRERLGPDFVTTLLHRQHPLHATLQFRGFLPLGSRVNFVTNSVNEPVSAGRPKWALEGSERDTW